ncbi:hypothetical protein B7463_g8701, partial [Scytalidium lignicola]
MSSSIFTKLLPELQQQVMNYCGTTELIHIASTCSALHRRAISALYHTVDISCHNEPGTFKAIGGPVPADYYDRAWGEGERAAYQKRQNRFAATIIKHPEYGIWVECLIWSYFGSEQARNGYDVGNNHLWAAFRLLRRLRSLDLISFAWGHERYPLPSFQFSNLEQIRIGGPMSSAFLEACIGSVDPAKLVTLDFDNLHNFGQMKEREEIDSEINLSKLDEYDDPKGKPMVRHPGPMRGYLQRLEGRCISLRRLALRSAGQDYDGDFFWSDAIDEQRYKEYASFIRSVRGTLQHLVFEQGIRQEKSYNPISYLGLRFSQIGARTMDKRFLKYILPVLVEGPWPALKMMEIFGLGGTPQPYIRFTPPDPQIFVEAKRQLATALGQNVILIVEENSPTVDIR